jgi:hypothetical protein
LSGYKDCKLIPVTFYNMFKYVVGSDILEF